MNDYAIAQLAQIRREELIADATLYRQTSSLRTRASNRPRSHTRRRLSGFHTWLAAGQL